MDARTLIERQIAAHEAVSKAERLAFLELSMAERGERLRAVCRTAADICASRVASGLPPCQKPPIPRHALEILSPSLRRDHVSAAS